MAGFFDDLDQLDSPTLVQPRHDDVTDDGRRKKYEDGMRSRGFVKTGVWVPDGHQPVFHAMARALRDDAEVREGVCGRFPNPDGSWIELTVTRSTVDRSAA